MTAKGKVNASKVQAGDRIIVRPLESDFREGTITPSATKTGEGVHVARVIGKTFVAARGPYERRGKYLIETTSGTFKAATIQTMWLAPEDAAGIKRAHAEAFLLDIARTVKMDIEEEAYAEDAERTAVQVPAGQAEKDAQISDWLDRHSIALGALTIAEATRVAKAYHAAIAKDRADAEAEDARRSAPVRIDTGIRVQGVRRAVSLDSKGRTPVCGRIPGLKLVLCNTMRNVRSTDYYEFVTCVLCSVALAEQEAPDLEFRVEFRQGIGRTVGDEIPPLTVCVPFSQRYQAESWIARKVHTYAEGFLLSTFFSVQAFLDRRGGGPRRGTVQIEGGRYGIGIIARIR